LEKQIITSIKSNAEQKRIMREKKNIPDTEIFDSDENFASIEGYTSGGFPYGLTYDEFDLDKIDLDEFELDEFELDEFELDEFDLDEIDLDEFELDEFELDEIEIIEPEINNEIKCNDDLIDNIF
jgi:hypothetical protein